MLPWPDPWAAAADAPLAGVALEDDDDAGTGAFEDARPSGVIITAPSK
jgi:hypothetical protein